MKENVDKDLDNLVEKMMRQSSLETPSFDFTSEIMGKVEAIKAGVSNTYEPLISKRGWLFILTISIALVIYFIWLGNPETSGWFYVGDFSFLSGNRFSEIFNGIQLSKTTSVSILMLAVMMLIQIPLLKYYFDKRVLN